jgi:hypothetical protein
VFSVWAEQVAPHGGVRFGGKQQHEIRWRSRPNRFRSCSIQNPSFGMGMLKEGRGFS